MSCDRRPIAIDIGLMTIRIPFNKPAVVGSELTYVGQAVAGGHASGNGPFTDRAESILEKAFDARRVLLTTSCTSALELAALLCDLQPGDEVIVPSPHEKFLVS